MAGAATGVPSPVREDDQRGDCTGLKCFCAATISRSASRRLARVSGGNVETFNTFTEEADKARLYGSLGIRISF